MNGSKPCCPSDKERTLSDERTRVPGRTTAFPSPRPSPLGRGRIVLRLLRSSERGVGGRAQEKPRKTNLITSLIPVLLAALLAACSKSGGENETKKSTANQSRVKRGTNGETIVTLDAPAQQRIGLKVTNPAAAQWQPEIRGYGRVLDPSPLAALMADLVQAHVAMETSQREFERLKTLAEQNNASVRAFQAADAAAKRDQVLVESLRTRLALGWGKAILERDDPPAFVRSLANGEQTLVRIDLPTGDSLKSPPSSARLVSFGDGERSITADFFDSSPTVDPQTQGAGFLFLIAGKPSGFSPNAAVTGYVKVPGDSLNGVTVSRDAVIRYEGKAWVYLQTGDNEFARREVPLDYPAENGWFVPSGVTDKDRIIVGGAQTILSTELSSGGFLSGERE